MIRTPLPLVPDQLDSRLHTPEVLEVVDRWQSMTLEGLDDRLGREELSPQPFEIGLGKFVNAVIVNAKAFRDGKVRVLSATHQQPWNKATAIRTLIDHDINNPNGTTIFLPNNGVGKPAYRFSDEHRELIERGHLRPFYEQQTLVLERIASRYAVKQAEWTMAGYSLGALTSIGVASVGSNDLDIRKVTAVEPPNVRRTPRQLRKDFLQSGTWIEQRRAIADARLPVLSSVQSSSGLAVDYLRFGLSTLQHDNAAIEIGMAQPGFNSLMQTALSRHDGLMIGLGHVVGSKVFVRNYVPGSPQRVNVQAFSGPATHRHATNENPFTNALMLAA